MSRVLTLICCSLLLLAATSCSRNVLVSRKTAKAIEQVKPKDLKAHIAYLADDRLLGRKPGTAGYQMAVEYVVAQMQALGVEPAGEDNTFLQRVRLRRAHTSPDASFSSTDSKGENHSLTNGKDFTIYPHAEARQVSLEAPLVFAGMGITAPELGYDDYAGIDAAGKIVVIFRTAPASFPATVANYSTDLLTILQNAANHGAVGVVIAATTPLAGMPNLQTGVHSVMDADGRVAFSRTFVTEQIQVLAHISHLTLQKFLRDTGIDAQTTLTSLKRGVPASAPLPVSASITYSSTFHDFDSYNVVGKITGSDETLKEEYVVHSAHLDHLGIGTPILGDSIYNGAHDNASGVASILEIARIYSHLKEKPKRSVLVVLLTAEELGLLGSAYFAMNPTVPKQNIVANINTDMPTIIAPLLSVVALGAAHSSLETQVAQASAYFGLGVEQDPEPEQNRFIRSDQYSFVVQGIPALHIKYGNKTADGKNNLSEKVQAWRAKYYHKPQDDINAPFDFEAGKKYVQLNFLIGYKVAQEQARPVWKAGDFFGERFGEGI